MKKFLKSVIITGCFGLLMTVLSIGTSTGESPTDQLEETADTVEDADNETKSRI